MMEESGSVGTNNDGSGSSRLKNIRILEAQKHTDPTDLDPQHWLLGGENELAMHT
jgi:hypothetical protein